MLTQHFHFGPALLEHSFRKIGLPQNGQLGKNIFENDFGEIYSALELADQIFTKRFRKSPAKVNPIQPKSGPGTLCVLLEYLRILVQGLKFARKFGSKDT